MRRLVSASFILIQLIVPLSVNAASSAPLSPIFVNEPLPEWSDAHVNANSTVGSQEMLYHKHMRLELSTFEAQWKDLAGTTAYVKAKRAFMQQIQHDHRVFVDRLVNGASSSVATTPSQPTTTMTPSQTQTPAIISGKAGISGRAALFTVLPKRSHRLLVQDVAKNVTKH